MSRTDPAEQRLAKQYAAYKLHEKVVDPAAHTKPARDAFDARFERQVDPDGVLEPADRARRAAYARKAHFTKMALLSAQARRKKAA